MNWPPLTAECSQTLANVLRDVVHSKPKDLIETVASILEEQSKWDPAEFEAYFEECKRKPRTYVLDLCPESQDPLTWVPMRYNDDTILLNLSQRAADLTGDILSAEPMEDTKDFMARACLAFPELQYLKGSPSEIEASQALRAICIACGGEEVPEFEDADPQLTFRCEVLVSSMRQEGGLLAAVAEDEELVEALLICTVLRVVGASEAFRRLYGHGATTAEAALLHAIDTHPEVLPSLQRLSEPRRQLLVATLQAYFPLDLIISTEAVPIHFQRVKELLLPLDSGVGFFLSVAAIEFMVSMRNHLVTDELADIVRLGAQCLSSVEKHTGAKAYEQLLKKRAEKHAWRLVRDDFLLRAVVRLCCATRREDTEWWQQVEQVVETLGDVEKEVLKVELGRKDGISESPVLAMQGLSSYMVAALGNDSIDLKTAIKLVINIVEDVLRLNAKSNVTLRVMTLRMEPLAAVARDWRSGSVPFEATPHVITELGAGELSVQLMGS